MTKKKTENYLEGVLNYYNENNRQQEQPEPIKEPEREPEPETQTETEPERKRVPESETGSFKGIDTTEREFKTRRVQLLLKPTIHDQLKELAEQLREETGNKKISVNEIVNQVLESFLKGVKE